MSARTYPYTAWVLLPSFKPKQVELVKQYGSWGGTSTSYDMTGVGKAYHLTELFVTLPAAIAAGRISLALQRIDLDKRSANLTKKHAALDKAEKETA